MVTICESMLCNAPAKYLIKKKSCPNESLSCCVYDVCELHYRSDVHRILEYYKFKINRDVKSIIQELRSW